jgi:D-alanyl-D-alanine carboxypeptidase
MDMLYPFRFVHWRAMRVGLCVTVLTGLCVGLSTRSLAQPRRDARGAIDSIVRLALADQKTAGMSVAVVRGRDTLLMQAYGRADLELNVGTPPDGVYEIGSITKQFTAAAILQLVEMGKLSLDDEVTRYVPAFVAGRHITVRQLLNHTSGIFDYLGLNGFLRLARVAVPHDSVVTLFSAQPPEFLPGTAMGYSNSGYFLLGMLVERLSGVSYESYVAAHLFSAAGMSSTRFCSNDRLMPRAVHGYDTIDKELRRARYIDFSWIFSAGAICSTPGDLIAWTQALHSGRILGSAAYRELITADTLLDGTRLRYAKALAVDTILGHRAIHHGGDITGFTSELTWLPDDSLVVVVLINTQGALRPDALSREIVRAVLGDRSPDRTPFRGIANDYVGHYAGTGRARRIDIATGTSGALTARIADGPVRVLSYVDGDTFASGDTRYVFTRQAGRVRTLRFDNVYDLTATVRSGTPQ